MSATPPPRPPSPRRSRRRWTRRLSAAVVVLYALITMVPLLWIVLTGFKTPPDSIAYPPKIVFEPSLEGYVNLFTTRTRQTPEYIASLPPAETWYDRLVRSRSMVIAGPSKFGERYFNSLVIGFGSTFLSVFLGTLGRLRLLALPGAAQGRSAVLHPLDAHDAADRGGDPDLPHVPRAGSVRHAARHDPALHRGQRVAGGVAAEGLHRRDPARVRRGGDDRRLHAACRPSGRWCCRRRPPASPRPRSSA